MKMTKMTALLLAAAMALTACGSTAAASSTAASEAASAEANPTPQPRKPLLHRKNLPPKRRLPTR